MLTLFINLLSSGGVFVIGLEFNLFAARSGLCCLFEKFA